MKPSPKCVIEKRRESFTLENVKLRDVCMRIERNNLNICIKMQ